MSTLRRTIPAYFVRALAQHADRAVLRDRQGTVTLAELTQAAASLATSLERRGVVKGDRIALYADNSRRWLVADLAAQLIGAVTVPRGTDTPAEEMAEFLEHAGATRAMCHDPVRGRALAEHAHHLVDLISIEPTEGNDLTIDQLAREGADGPTFEERAAHVQEDDLVTIIYTSGTTGRPKGVMLTQRNFGHQVEVLPGVLDISKDERFLSLLPIWHIFERTVEYVALTNGCQLMYTDRRRLKEDMRDLKPTFFPSVPRIWETVYDGVHKAISSGSPLTRSVFKSAYAFASFRAKHWDRARGHHLRVHAPKGLVRFVDPLARAGHALGAALAYPLDRLAHRLVFRKLRAVTGGALRGAVSGGGLMPAHVERFFRTIGLPVLVGYGLTETSPVLSIRREERNILGTIGVAVPEVEIEIRDPETGAALPPGRVGVVHTRGPQVMRGYYKDDEQTRSVVDADGWFDTGDLGMLTHAGDLCFRGRKKETIVLRGGENVDPGAVEESLLASPYIAQAIVVGQDQKQIAALIVPQTDNITSHLNVVVEGGAEALAEMPDVVKLLRNEAARTTSTLKPFERVHRISVLPNELTPEDGTLTQTLKPRRHVIATRFAETIEGMFTP